MIGTSPTTRRTAKRVTGQTGRSAAASAVVRKEASPPPPGGASAATPNYPRGSTDNKLLMNGARVLTEYGTPQATVLYIVIVVRCGGKALLLAVDPAVDGLTRARVSARSIGGAES